jgi:hypothetical protein
VTVKKISALVVAASACFVTSCDDSNSSGGFSGNGTVPSSVEGTQGNAYRISVFAANTDGLRPDDMVQLGSSVYVIYQDPNVNPDGTLPAGVTSAQAYLYQYDLNGKLQQSYKLPGHPDGLAQFDSGTLWISSNEDANPVITTLDTGSGTLTSYTSDTAPLPNGGGLDDLKVVNGVVYASASNPTTTASPSPNLAPYSTDASGATAEYGVNTGPALYAVSLNSDGKTFHPAVVLSSSTPATAVADGSAVTLNMTDTDSSAIDPAGDLVIDSQQDSELVFVSNVGTAKQAVSVLNMTLYGNPWPLDDTRWSPASGSSFMLVTDTPAKIIYRIDAAQGFTPGTAYSAGQGTVLQSNTSTGEMTPIYVGMNNPHGLIFVSN